MNCNVLVIDDDATTRETLQDIISRMGHTAILAGNGEDGLEHVKKSDVDLVLVDLVLPRMDGLDFVDRALREKPDVPVVVITGQPSTSTTVQAIKRGAQDYLVKPLDLTRLRTVITNSLKLRTLQRVNQNLQEQVYGKSALDKMIGSGAAMKRLFETVQQVARSDSTALITGESGTGKELVANALHALSPRSHGPFLKLNSAAFPRDLLESELFGHEKGAFTGAIKQKKGKLELADDGTFFLDEIGEMPLEIQVKLLRVLEERAFTRVGGNEQIKVNVRLITATNADLKKLLAGGQFREDLYYRINVIHIHLPPLRERLEDLPLLVERFLDDFYQRDGKRKRFSPDAMTALSQYTWPGNIRELRNVVERAVIVTPGEMIGMEHLPPEIMSVVRPSVPAAGFSTQGRSLDELEKQAIIEALQTAQGNKTKAARALGIGLKTLYRKLERYNISN